MTAKNKYLVKAHRIKANTLSNERVYYERFFKKGNKILDLGCSTGRFLTCDPENITGIEHDPYLVKYGKEHGLNIILSDLIKDKLPFPNNSFDAVNMRAIIEHFHEPELVLFEVYRVLKPGGKVVIWTPDVERIGFKFWDCTSHYSPFTKLKAYLMVEEVGFKDITVNNNRLSFTGLGWLARRGFNANKILDFINFFGIKDVDVLVVAFK